MPLDKEIDFCIDLESGTHPIYVPPYLMALTKLRDLNTQLLELLDKGFVHLCASPLGA